MGGRFGRAKVRNKGMEVNAYDIARSGPLGGTVPVGPPSVPHGFLHSGGVGTIMWADPFEGHAE